MGCLGGGKRADQRASKMDQATISKWMGSLGNREFPRDFRDVDFTFCFFGDKQPRGKEVQSRTSRRNPKMMGWMESNGGQVCTG
jgi:hypothetical protein